MRRSLRHLLLEPLEPRTLLSADLFNAMAGSSDLLQTSDTLATNCGAQNAALPTNCDDQVGTGRGDEAIGDSAAGIALSQFTIDISSMFDGLVTDPTRYDDSTILVRMRPDVDLEYLRTEIGLNLSISDEIQLVPGLRVVELAAGMSVQQGLEIFLSSESVMYAEPNYYFSLDEAVFPNDPNFTSQWALHNTGQSGGTVDADIDAPEAWGITTGSSSVVVAVIDSGVDYNHPDLAANIWINPGEIAGDGIDNDNNGYVDDVRGWDFVNNDNDPMDDHSHGTHIAGSIAAVGNNAAGVTGIAWNAKIMPLKWMGSSLTGSLSNAVKSLNYAVAMGATVSNNSWSGSAYLALRDAIANAGQAGHIFVTSAGNSNANNDVTAHYPSNYDLENIITVAATDRNDVKASFSNYGLVSVDLGAPGVDIYSTWMGGGYGNKSGTSMAAPHVTGAVALIQSLRPEWSVAQVKQAILSTVDPIASLAGKTVTGGRLNVGAAVAYANPDEPPAGNAPVAGDDAIQVAEGATSTVLVGDANSLLSNDTDADLPSDSLTVNTTPVTNVSHGTLTLYADGTFRYVHDGSESLTDSFVYQVRDAAGHTDTGTVTITVSAVNDAPTLTVPGAKSVNEDASLAITGISVADVDAAPGTVKVTVSVTSGQLTLAQTTGLTFSSGDGTSDASMVFTGTLANVNSALATINYLGNANFSGSDTLTVSVDDQGNTGSGGAKTDSKSVAITVSAVNDTPALTVPGAQAATEDTVKAITGITVADVDAGSSPVKITISVVSGTLTLAQTTGLTFTTGDGTSDASMVFTGTLTNVNSALATINYLGNANFNGSDTLTVSVDDLGNTGSGGAKTDSKSVAITVSAVNDTPVLAVPGAQAAIEDTVKAITGITVADVDAGSNPVKITISVVSGTLTLAQTTGLTFTTGDGTSDTSMVFTGTLTNVNSALATINYLGNANFNGSDTLTVSVDDQGNTGSGGAKTDSKSVAITVSAVNDSPILTVPGAQTATEDTVKAITGISVADMDAAIGAMKITIAVVSGSFSLAQTTGLTFSTGDGTSDTSMVFTGTLTNVNSALATINYLGNANFNGSDTLTVSVDDQGNTGSGGAMTDSKSVAITVSALNDSPALTVPGAQAATEDTAKAITGISVTDVDAGSSPVKITISVVSGTLTLAQTTGLTFTTGDGTSDASMVFTGTLTNVNSALATINYLGNANFNGSDTLTVSVDDQGNTGSGGAKTDSKSVAITVAAVNDTPILTVPSAKTVAKNTLLSITGMSVADVDAAVGLVQMSLSVANGRVTLAQTTGLTFSAGDGTGDTTMTFTGTVANVNAALARVDYLSNTDYIGTDTLSISVDDQGNTGSGGAKTDAKTIDVTLTDSDPLAQLVAWWKFNDASGTRAADSAPSGVDDSGTLRDQATWNIYGSGGAVSLDGNGDYVEVPGTTDVNNRTVTTRTISGWFYVNDKSLSSRNQVIFEEGGDQRGLNIYVSNGRLYVGGWNIPTTESGWAGTFLSTDQIQSGKWHHVALVLNGGATVTSGAFRGYLDGVEFGSGVGSQLWAHSDPTGIGQGAAYVRFHNGLQSGGNGFAGMLDDVRVYNRALSASEVAQLATQPMAAPCQLTVTVTPTGVWENGAPITGTVSRTGSLDRALVVTLTSSQAARLAMPTTVTIGVGETSANFELTPQDNSLADGDVQAVLTATATGCTSGTDSLEVWDNEPSTQTLVAYWAMNEGAGVTANDSAPQGTNDVATLRGNAAWSPMGLGRSVQLKGGTDIIAVPDSAEINLMTVTQRTVALWFNVDAAAIAGSRQVLFEEGGTDRGINVYLDGGRLYVGGWNVKKNESNWAGTFLSTDQLQPGRWHHVTLVLNGGATVQANGLKAYLDGMLFGSGVGSQLWSHGDDTGLGRSAQYTRFHNGIGTSDLHGVAGLMDEVRIYNRVLRDSEIQVLASQTLIKADGLTVTLSANSMPERDGTVQGTVTRSGSTAGELVVTLSSSDTSEATVPSTVTLAAGQASATFTVRAQDDLVRAGTTSVTVNASATGLVSGSGQVQVTDDEKLLVQGVASNVSNNWVTVNLPQSYNSMVVMATPSYTQSGIPVVTRVRNASGNSFELRVDRADGLTGAVPGVSVHYVVADEGVYTQARDGVTMEVVKYASTVTDSAGSFVGESRAYAQAYKSPVVLGQVQTYNDANFSVFFSRGATAADPASSTVLRVGKHVGEDAVKTRAAETVGYFVIEAGLANAGGVVFSAAVGNRTVQGMGNSPPYTYRLNGLTAASVAVASMAGQVGADGGWAVLYGTGSDAVNASRLQLAIDEDQKRDAERAHATENVSYLVFQDTALTLTGAAERRGEAVELRLDQVHQLVQRAMVLWDTHDEDSLASDFLADLELRIEDLPGDELGRATQNGLIIDIDAAGQGWFVDPTPLDDEEFVRGLVGVYKALEGTDAADHVDLLSVLAHELGHLRGIGHDHADRHSVMAPSIGTGIRRVPVEPQADSVRIQEVPQRVGVESFLASSRNRKSG